VVETIGEEVYDPPPLLGLIYSKLREVQMYILFIKN